MRIAINILKQPFIKLFLLLGFLEILIFIALICSYYIPSRQVKENLIDKIEDNSKDLITSFSTLLNNKHLSVLKELMIIRKHMKYLENEANLDNSLTSYTDKCILPQEELSTYLSVNNYVENNSYSSIIDYFIITRDGLYNNDINSDSSLTEKLLSKLISDDYPLSKLSVNTASDALTSNNYNLKQLCYLVSVLKSLTIKDILHLTPMKKYFILSNDAYYFSYPLENTSLSSLKKSSNYLNSEKCLSKYSSKSCFKTFLNLQESDEIIFQAPVIDSYSTSLKVNSKIISISCTKILISSSRKDQWACIEFDLLKDVLYQYTQMNDPTTTVRMFLINYEGPDLKLIYTNKIFSLTKHQKVFDKEVFKRFRISEDFDSSALDLFHGLYYNIFLHFSNLYKQTEIMEDLLEEYNNIKETIIKAITSLETNLTNKKFTETKIADDYHSAKKYIFEPIIVNIESKFMGYKMDYKSFEGKIYLSLKSLFMFTYII